MNPFRRTAVLSAFLSRHMLTACAMLAAVALLWPRHHEKPEPTPAATTTVNYSATQSGNTWMNTATQLALTSTEQSLAITVANGFPVLVQFAPPASGANSWTYSLVSSQSTQTTTVAAGQSVNLWFDRTTTVYLVSSSGVTISVSAIYYTKR